MKTTIAALTLILFAGAATAALAQESNDRDRGESRGETRAEHPAAPERAAPQFRSEGRQERPAPPPRTEPSAPAPTAEARSERRGDGVRGGGEHRGGEARGGGGTDATPQAPRFNGGGGERSAQVGDGNRQPRGDRADGQRRWDGQNRGDNNNTGGGARPDGARPDGGRSGGWNGQGRGGDRQGGDRGRNDGDRHDGNRGRWDGNRHDGDRNGANRGGWNRDDHGRPRWDRHNYPPVYRSHQRYRHTWRPPFGFYTASWAFGDMLPIGWYAPEYRLYDWWNYDLPAPPPGYDWVRVGYDAMLVDDFDGRIVQVVRLVFY